MAVFIHFLKETAFMKCRRFLQKKKKKKKRITSYHRKA